MCTDNLHTTHTHAHAHAHTLLKVEGVVPRVIQHQGVVGVEELGVLHNDRRARWAVHDQFRHAHRVHPKVVHNVAVGQAELLDRCTVLAHGRQRDVVVQGRRRGEVRGHGLSRRPRRRVAKRRRVPRFLDKTQIRGVPCPRVIRQHWSRGGPPRLHLAWRRRHHLPDDASGAGVDVDGEFDTCGRHRDTLFGQKPVAELQPHSVHGTGVQGGQLERPRHGGAVEGQPRRHAGVERRRGAVHGDDDAAGGRHVPHRPHDGAGGESEVTRKQPLVPAAEELSPGPVGVAQQPNGERRRSADGCPRAVGRLPLHREGVGRVCCQRRRGGRVRHKHGGVARLGTAAAGGGEGSRESQVRRRQSLGKQNTGIRRSQRERERHARTDIYVYIYVH